MASSVEQASAGSFPSPEVVGYAFVQQYYHILHQSPNLVFRFYQDSSKLGRPDNGGIMSSVSTMDAINQKIISLDYGGLSAEIKTVDAQGSLDGSVLVLVTGYLTGKDDVKRNFTQTFFLAPQDKAKSYFVLNDMFRYVENPNIDDNKGYAGEVDVPVITEQESAVEAENHAPEQMSSCSEEVNLEEVCNPPEKEEHLAAEEESPVSEVVDECNGNSHMVTESTPKIEDVQKKSYASIVMKEGGPSLPINSPPQRALPKEPVAAAQQPATALPPPEKPVVSSNIVENGNSKEVEADGYSIYVNGLPMNATPALLESEFKRFGPIRSNGIQVRSNNGFCFGFVEFDVPTAVQSAIKESPINIGGCQVRVEVKRSTNSRVGSSRGRLPNGRGGIGYRNDGGRGRMSYVGGGGRGFGRGDFVSRGGGRGGGYSLRGGGGDGGFQRVVDHDGSNGGGRGGYPSGPAVPATRNMAAHRVPAVQ